MIPTPKLIGADHNMEIRWRGENKLLKFFPEAGPYRRDLYPKHMQFFAAGGNHEILASCPSGCTGAWHRERCFLAGNRTGKTTAGAYESALHLTGDYPDWWPGKRFKTPVSMWAAGTTNEKVKEIVQAELFGAIERDGTDSGPVGIGTGMIPAEKIVHTQMRSGSPNTIQQAWVKHVSGGRSVVELKSYEMGRAAFEGTARHLIWLDEEPPMDVYTECLLRTMTTDGMVMITFTPLQGLSEVVLSFLPGGVPGSAN
jgi:phage terminase large subunit-like protein